MSDTPRAFCPECETAADEYAELLVVEYCGNHRLQIMGLDDAIAAGPLWDSGSAETTGEQNRAACEVIHRSQRPGEPE